MADDVLEQARRLLEEEEITRPKHGFGTGAAPCATAYA